MARIILLVDMDSFYAQVEERDDPGLKGMAVVVCMFSGRGKDSGAVATANYKAREAGIKAGMPISRARKLDPDAIYLPARRDYYTEVSDRIMGILRGYADSFEQVSVDEAYLDVTDKTKGDMERGVDIARSLKAKVMVEEKLTCSVGIGPNKLIAKMAAGVQKPDGLTVVKEDGVESFLAMLPVKELFGVGKKTAEKLGDMAIDTVGELARIDALELMETFGRARGKMLYEASKGIDISPVEERGEKEQMGRMATLKEDTRDLDGIMGQLEPMAMEVFGRIRAKGLNFRTVTITAITPDLKGHTKSRTLPFPVQDLGVMKRLGRELMGEFLEENPGEIRRAGVRVSELSETGGQRTLMDY